MAGGELRLGTVAIYMFTIYYVLLDMSIHLSQLSSIYMLAISHRKKLQVE
jgi:hypothetical protein